MCGRFTLTADAATLQDSLDLGHIPAELEPRYNVAPTQPVAVVTDANTRDVELFRWGLIPSWAKEAKIGYRMINARAETVAQKPAFRAAFARRRCLVLADGFYEWQRINRKKQPYYFHLEDGQPFAFAGLWEVWQPQKEADPLFTCTIITTAANERVAPIHQRSPMILLNDTIPIWLSADASREELRHLLNPLPADAIELYPVSTLVNNVRNDHPSLIEPTNNPLHLPLFSLP